MKKIKAPFSNKEVEVLNRFQALSMQHPFTCINVTCREDLRAINEGWVCDKCNSGVQQTWAHRYMAIEDIVAERERMEEEIFNNIN